MKLSVEEYLDTLLDEPKPFKDTVISMRKLVKFLVDSERIDFETYCDIDDYLKTL